MAFVLRNICNALNALKIVGKFKFKKKKSIVLHCKYSVCQQKGLPNFTSCACQINCHSVYFDKLSIRMK